MPKKRFQGMSRASKGGHFQIEGLTTKTSLVSALWSFEQHEHREDFVHLNGGDGSSEHLGWVHTARPSKQRQTNAAIPYLISGSQRRIESTP